MADEITAHGFTWGPVEVTRMATAPDGRHILRVSTDHDSITVYVSPTGRKVRVWRQGHELKPPLSCGCPPEHHDEAERRAANPAERRALLARLTQQSRELGTYDKRVTEES